MLTEYGQELAQTFCCLLQFARYQLILNGDGRNFLTYHAREFFSTLPSENFIINLINKIYYSYEKKKKYYYTSEVLNNYSVILSTLEILFNRYVSYKILTYDL